MLYDGIIKCVLYSLRVCLILILLQNKWVFTVINFVLIAFIFLLFSSSYELVELIDILFYFCFFYLFIGLLLWIIKGGFFDAITYSFRRVANRTTKNSDYMDDFEEKPLPSKFFKRKNVNFFLFQGSAMLLTLLILLAAYYY
ncbi:DUF3899 domain-containing protein [Halobacillus campisalis]|uniref:DUF3899 domain-containing protein n=1 Tax=Halobacillus campisalis TaxID=435909 RepID=A0ABW2K584_9BACI